VTAKDFQEFEQRLLEETLRYTKGNKTLAAKLLGIDPKTVFRKLKQAGPEEAGPEDDESAVP
jgi:two-component system response regulator HydG